MPDGNLADWMPEARARQLEFLAEVRRRDAAAIAEIAQALTALRRSDPPVRDSVH